mmetsp:Transcript_17254/g.47423  ORF Transcript_17254/g.47423 Transcript_17254/m.47423 type:complete len:281 (+) Transcript_17254:160-1002(+)
MSQKLAESITLKFAGTDDDLHQFMLKLEDQARNNSVGEVVDIAIIIAKAKAKCFVHVETLKAFVESNRKWHPEMLTELKRILQSSKAKTYVAEQGEQDQCGQEEWKVVLASMEFDQVKCICSFYGKSDLETMRKRQHKCGKLLDNAQISTSAASNTGTFGARSILEASDSIFNTSARLTNILSRHRQIKDRHLKATVGAVIKLTDSFDGSNYAAYKQRINSLVGLLQFQLALIPYAERVRDSMNAWEISRLIAEKFSTMEGVKRDSCGGGNKADGRSVVQ